MFGFGKQRVDAIEISPAAWDEITAAFGKFAVGRVDENGWFDLTGVRLVRGEEPEPEPLPAHRPIAPPPKKKNTAPGAIS